LEQKTKPFFFENKTCITSIALIIPSLHSYVFHNHSIVKEFRRTGKACITARVKIIDQHSVYERTVRCLGPTI